MKIVFATLMMLTSFSWAKTCEIYVRSVANKSSYLETKCSDGTFNSNESKYGVIFKDPKSKE